LHSDRLFDEANRLRKARDGFPAEPHQLADHHVKLVIERDCDSGQTGYTVGTAHWLSVIPIHFEPETAKAVHHRLLPSGEAVSPGAGVPWADMVPVQQRLGVAKLEIGRVVQINSSSTKSATKGRNPCPVRFQGIFVGDLGRLSPRHP
jgi:hypothetical protein